MIINLERPQRAIGSNTFADITTANVVGEPTWNDAGEVVVEFSRDLNAEELRNVRLWAASNSQAEANALQGAPSGAVLMWFSGNAPGGWIIAEGQLLNRAGQYAGIFAVHGHRGSGGVAPNATQFRLFNPRNRVLIGAGTFAAVGENEGISAEEDRTLRHKHGAGTLTGTSVDRATGGANAMAGPITGDTELSARDAIPFLAFNLIVKI